MVEEHLLKETWDFSVVTAKILASHNSGQQAARSTCLSKLINAQRGISEQICPVVYTLGLILQQKQV